MKLILQILAMFMPMMAYADPGKIGGIDLENGAYFDDYNIMNKVARDFVTNVDYDSTDYSYTLILASMNIPTDYNKQHPAPIPLKWSNPDNLAKTLKVADNDNFENASTFDIASTAESFDLYNLCPEKTYYINLSSANNVILSNKIDITGERRFLNIDGVSNVRDFGGFKTVDGHTIAFEKIIRGGTLGSITTQGKNEIKGLVGVNAEIDLRPSPDSSSPLGNDVVFDAIPIAEAYDCVVTTSFTGNAPCRQALKALLRNLNNGKITYIHCKGGADRTGTLALLLLALCGVSESEVVKDYELTTFSGINRYRTTKAFIPLITNIKLRQGSTFQEKVKNWWLENDGTYVVTESELNEFKSFMINSKKIIEMEDPSIRTFDVETAGTLSAILLENEVDPLEITELTLTGQLNGDDFALLRAMAGNDMKGEPTEGKLSKLDISGATIVAGGTYMDLDDQFINLGNGDKYYGFTDDAMSSVANTLGDFIFAGCQQLTSVKTPTSLTTIGDRAFAESGLTSIELNSGQTTLDTYAFWHSKLSSITIPQTVTHIASQAFGHNQNLETVVSYITTPFDINDDVFAISETTYPETLIVPSGTKALYEAKTGWNRFANIIEMGQEQTITITAKNYSRAYGEANPTFESEITGGTVTGTPEITCAATATSGVGTYDIVITAGTITDPNVQYVNGKLTVTKAPLKITAGSYTKKQDEENPEFGVTYEGFKNSETDAVLTTKPTVTCAATKDSPVGTYDITVSGAVAANYEISYVAGTLTIEAAPAPEPTPEPIPDPTPDPTPESTPEPTPEPTPMPEPKGTIFDVNTDDSSTEVKISFVVKESDSAGTPTVAVSDDKDASGSVSIPESVTHNGVEYKVTEISEGAFQNNTSLTEVKIPASITSIGPNAFAGCKNLQEITINIIVPINISVISARGLTRTESSNPVFKGVDMDKCILYVPEGSMDAYKAALGWKDFKNIVVIGTATGIKGILLNNDSTFDIYNLQGGNVKVKATSLDGLPKGIYIINGQKLIKK